MRRTLAGLSSRIALAMLACASVAHATWSIVLIDTRTGEVAVGSATCLTNFDLQAGTPVLLTGIGGATAQSSVDSTAQNRTFIRDQLLLGTPPETIVELLADFDPGHQSRQYGIADTMGGTATFSGSGAGEWKGGVTGQVGDIVYAIQGNVLTGAPVVMMAEQAVLNTEGDLAAKLVAAMEAARSMGGDGRCSCSPNDPTGCGSPPPNFDKSAHIAYMLIARTGDLDICNASYRAGTQPWALDTGDVDGDASTDVVVADRPGAQFVVLYGAPIEGFTGTVLSEPTFYPAGGEPYDVALADLNGDTYLDLVGAIQGANQIGVRFGGADATFGPQTDYPMPDEPTRVDVADVNQDGHPDLVIVLDDTGGLIAINDGNGAFNDTIPISGLTKATAIATADLDGDGDIDAAVTDTSSDGVVLFINNAGSYDLTTFVPVESNPADVKAADLDGDGDQDLLVANNADSSATVLLKNADLSYSPATYETWPGPARIEINDLDADGNLDAVVLSNATRFAVLRAVGAGAFEVEAIYPTLGNNGDMALADMDGDADLDVALATRVPGTIYVVPNLGDGIFNPQLGCASGDHFMQFNIPFQAPSDLDPVFQLEALYDTWREDLVGRPDAVVTTATLDPPSIPGDEESTTTLTITPLDWQGLGAGDSVQSVTVEHAPGSDHRSTIGDVVNNQDGTWSVIITAGNKPAHDRFRVVIDDAIRPVSLMPDPALDLTVNIDFNKDGALNVLDFVAFQLAFAAGDDSADVDADGALTTMDFVVFTQAFQAN